MHIECLMFIYRLLHIHTYAFYPARWYCFMRWMESEKKKKMKMEMVSKSSQTICSLIEPQASKDEERQGKTNRLQKRWRTNVFIRYAWRVQLLCCIMDRWMLMLYVCFSSHPFPSSLRKKKTENFLQCFCAFFHTFLNFCFSFFLSSLGFCCYSVLLLGFRFDYLLLDVASSFVHFYLQHSPSIVYMSGIFSSFFSEFGSYFAVFVLSCLVVPFLLFCPVLWAIFSAALVICPWVGGYIRESAATYEKSKKKKMKKNYGETCSETNRRRR